MSTLIQNFSVGAGNSQVINFDIGPDEGVSLADASIFWRVYEQANGITSDDPPVITKSTGGSGITVTDPTALKLTIELTRADTLDLLRNYYHELMVENEDESFDVVACGIMTVTTTKNRET